MAETAKKRPVKPKDVDANEFAFAEAVYKRLAELENRVFVLEQITRGNTPESQGFK